MSALIKVGVKPQPDLPTDRLTQEELGELRQLLIARQSFVEQAQAVEQRIQVLLLTSRDHRGLQGEVRIDPESGNISREE